MRTPARSFPPPALASAVVILSFALVARAGSGGLVFCVGADGHQGVESAFAQECCAEFQHARADEVSIAPQSCDCTDTPLLVKVTLESAPRTSSTAWPRGESDWLPLVLGKEIAPLLSRATLGQMHRTSPAVLARLRFVILLV